MLNGVNYIDKKEREAMRQSVHQWLNSKYYETSSKIMQDVYYHLSKLVILS
jgi:hypothetical protein